MKNNFQIKKINSPFEDSAFFVRNVYKKSAFLLDCGRLGNISNTEILSVTDVFVSHTHIDHFYGFDRLLRGFIRADKKIRFFGPPNFINNVKGKLAGYTWNLIKNYTLVIEANELYEDKIKTAIFRAEDGFIPEEYEKKRDLIDLGDGFTLDYEFFDHGILTVGYRIKEDIHVSIRKDALEELGYKKGPWISELKSKLRLCQKDGFLEVEKDGNVVVKSLKELEKELVLYSPAQDITYITDVAPTFENFKKAVTFSRNSHILMIEGMFLKSDLMHAIRKKHLTLELAKEIFIASNSKFVHFFHFAPKYEIEKELFFSTLYKGIDKKVI
ncbi:MAG: ribonuclease [Deferribacteres bacterium]|jgi:ribonuclease Z|nr:ribonuclease [Deferribacteraceae bacterium]MDK2792920.1 ribonuclease [Deferribacteres bacterium]